MRDLSILLKLKTELEAIIALEKKGESDTEPSRKKASREYQEGYIGGLEQARACIVAYFQN